MKHLLVLIDSNRKMLEGKYAALSK